jgi:hypothetical protein
MYSSSRPYDLAGIQRKSQIDKSSSKKSRRIKGMAKSGHVRAAPSGQPAWVTTAAEFADVQSSTKMWNKISAEDLISQICVRPHRCLLPLVDLPTTAASLSSMLMANFNLQCPSESRVWRNQSLGKIQTKGTDADASGDSKYFKDWIQRKLHSCLREICLAVLVEAN